MKRNENKKSLKKKVLVVSGLALLLGLIGYTGGNTYAKYITEGQVASQTATVAKWGVVLNATANNSGFGSDYNDGTKVTTAGDGLEVNASTTTLAPGTSGSFTFNFSGTPEVSNEVSFNMVVNSDVHVGDYYPVKWTISDGTNKIADAVKLSEAATALNAHVVYNAAGTNIAQTYTISWEWAFSQDDTADTTLGNYAAGLVTKPAEDSITVDFTIRVNVEQTEDHGNPNA